MNQSMIDRRISKSHKMVYKLEPLTLENGKAGLRQPLGIPVYQCLKKDIITFNKWMKNENHIFIGSQLAKHSGDITLRDAWSIPWMDDSFANGEITAEEYLRMYEDYVRAYWWDTLEILYFKTCGCFCENVEQCRYSVLRKCVYKKVVFNK